jgi:hypothetical protein
MAPRLPDADQAALLRLVGRGISRFPPKKLLHMPGSSTTLGRPDARADASDRVAFRLRNSVGAQDANLYEAQRLAYALPYRRFAVALADDRARLRADADRYSFIVSDLHRLLLADLSGALRNIPYVIQDDKWNFCLTAGTLCLANQEIIALRSAARLCSALPLKRCYERGRQKIA